MASGSSVSVAPRGPGDPQIIEPMPGVAPGGGLTVQDEGVPLPTDATTLNFIGAGVTASGAGAVKTIAIPGPLVEEFAITTLAHPVPVGRTLAIIEAAGAGGGGASGLMNASLSARLGGGAGGAGGRSIIFLPVSLMSPTIDVVVGTKGTGGAAQTLPNSNGIPGLPGGDCWVAPAGGTEATAYVVAGGGGGGISASGASSSNAQWAGTPGGNSSITVASAAPVANSAAGTGGGGGGITNTDVALSGAVGTAGGWAGGAGPALAAAARGPAVVGGTAGGANVDGGNAPAPLPGRLGAGGGGGGGYGGVQAGKGGDGAAPGGGGGGGGAGLNAVANSGKGGDGADGFVRIVWL